MKSHLLLIAQLGFSAITLIYLLIFIKEVKTGVDQTSWSAQKKKNFVLSSYLIPALIIIFSSVWALSGLMSDFSNFPFNFAPVLFLPLITVVALMFNASLGEVLRRIPPHRIIQLQSFRIFVELLLWVLFIDELLPKQMTFEGRNFDIIAGITAPVVAYLAAKNRLSNTVLIVWNFAGLALLANIVTVAILSTPSPIRVFFEEPANTIVAYFPISLLPGILVPLAYTLHLFSLKQLFAAKRKANVTA